MDIRKKLYMSNHGVWLRPVIILPERYKINVFGIKKYTYIFQIHSSASLVDKEMTSGLLFRRCDFAAINTGVSEIPFASFDRVFPVHGAMTRISSMDFGPIGSASGMVRIGSFPV